MEPLNKSHKPSFSWLPTTIQIISALCLVPAIIALNDFAERLPLFLGGIVSFIILLSLSLIVKAAIIYIDKNE